MCAAASAGNALETYDSLSNFSMSSFQKLMYLVCVDDVVRFVFFLHPWSFKQSFVIASVVVV